MEDSYYAFDRIKHISSRSLPSRDEIHDITKQLFGLIYPGFFGDQNVTHDNCGAFVRETLESVGSRLYHIIYQCLSYKERSDRHRHMASDTVVAFLGELPKVREVLASDVLAGYRGDPASQGTDEVVFSYPATIAVGTYRLAHELRKFGVPLMPRIMTEHAHNLTGVDISPGAHIGRGFFIDHGTGVVVGETAIIGDNCKLYQGVTLGAISFPHDEEGQIIRGHKRHPTLGDEVVVYSNATVLGNVTIGKGSTIGGGVFLTRSVPPGCTVSAKQAELRYRNRCDFLGRGHVTEFDI
ncbi:MAG: serine O-acetyltransferase [Phycisphaerae bacterium]|nr:serine O-acetyltransferase [Phycisphaerae bacterium]